ncbi:MAG: hypothetical protein ACOCQX_01260 [Candidatus Nanoarchaeia archaeon]
MIVGCPYCKQKMNYLPRGKLDRQKRKRCVYCGKSFKVVEQIK